MWRRKEKRVKPATTDAELAPGPQLAMLALRSVKGLTETAICRAWRELFPQERPLEFKQRSKELWEFAAGDRAVMVMAMPMPIPAGDIEWACRQSWMWPEAAEAMKAQRAHLLVTAVPAGKPVEEALLVSRVIAAAATAGDPVGVYWGSGGQVHKPALFVDAVRDMVGDGLYPVPMWVGLRVSADQPRGPFTLTTQGLRPFGHWELEIIDSPRRLGELRDFAYATISYLLAAGPVLKNGHTVSGPNDEPIRVEHTTSQFRDGEAVLRLHA